MNSNGRKRRNSCVDEEVCASSMRGKRKSQKKSKKLLTTAGVVRDYAVAHSVAHFVAKPAQNTPNPCNALCCKLLICIRRAYYLADFKTAAFNHSATPPR